MPLTLLRQLLANRLGCSFGAFSGRAVALGLILVFCNSPSVSYSEPASDDAAATSASSPRAVKFAKAEISVFLQNGKSVRIELPQKFFAMFYDQDRGLKLKSETEAVVLTRSDEQSKEIPGIKGRGTAAGTFPTEGVPFLVTTADKRVFAFRALPANAKQPADQVVSVADDAPLPTFPKEIVASAKEEIIYVSERAPTLVAFPANIRRVLKNNSSALWPEGADNFLVVYPQADLSVVGDAVLVELANNRVYGLRFASASDKHPRQYAAIVTDPAVLPIYGTELKYKPGAEIYVLNGEPTLVVFPGKITTQFKSGEIVGLDIRKFGKALVLIPYPAPILPTNRMTVQIESGEKFELKILRASKGNSRMWSVKIK